ncbi:MAG: YihA family ribosome biogenesis GTP-binding protein [Firmicutes bacterium]|nr:YihA family ribosome biogenesis GTP-binding protein [Bacillota bacterium]
MKVKFAELATSAVKRDQYPADRGREIVLLGRSNAGKSSLINVMINRKNLARTSSAPGKTRLLNFYRVRGELAGQPQQMYFVDLPGYGYAKVSHSERDRWLDMIDSFLTDPGAEKYCWQLVDIRHAPSAQDITLHNTLKAAGYRMLTIVNKADKVSKNQRAGQLKLISQTLGVPKSELMVFSAITKEGAEQLWELADAFLLEGREEAEAMAKEADSAAAEA